MCVSQDYDYLFKIIAVGDGGCGKTALTIRFAHGYFQESYKMTIGVEFAVKLIEIAGNKTKLQIWDTGGQERFSYVRPLYYRGAMGALVLFDVTNRESFDHVPNWLEEVNQNVGEVPMVLVGNKADLVDERQVTFEEGKAMADRFGMLYLESSAKTGEGVGDCFAVLGALMIGIEPTPEMLGVSPEPAIPKEIEIPVPEPGPLAPPVPEPEPLAPPVPDPAPLAPPVP
ncbi:MAG: GTP-binding protein, partial [Promethearchaeota archaeon]